jgi:cytochrome c-type biogenesis protein CcmH
VKDANGRIAIWMTFVLLGVLLVAALPTAAQDAANGITFDQVNEIARDLYCPICPNETLDVCQTQACIQWRQDIRNQLAEGQTEEQIIDSFVQRYGDRVLGTPQDPTLRILSLATPFLIAGAALVIGIFTFLRWRGRPIAAAPTPQSAGTTSARGDKYREQLERDLNE